MVSLTRKKWSIHRVISTVLACKDHNSAFSALDEEFQLYIESVARSHISVSDFKDRTVRSLERKEAKGFIERLRANTFYENIDGEKTPADLWMQF